MRDGDGSARKGAVCNCRAEKREGAGKGAFLVFPGRDQRCGLAVGGGEQGENLNSIIA
jgi:hypothetical protein